MPAAFLALTVVSNHSYLSAVQERADRRVAEDGEKQVSRHAKLVKALGRKAPVLNQIRLVMTGQQPELEHLFAERALIYQKEQKGR